MTTNRPANQVLDVPPNRLRVVTAPNTLGGVGLPGAAARVHPLPYVTAAGVVLAVLALLLLVWRQS